MAVFVIYGSVAYNRYLTSPNDRELNLLPIRAVESFCDALWLELWPFLCFMGKSR